MNDYDLMVDMEALSSYCDGVVLSLAIVPFKMKESNTLEQLLERSLYLKLDVASQRPTRKLEPDTINWWKKQSDDAKKILLPSEEDVSMSEALDLIDAYVPKWYKFKGGIMWNRGTNYDWPLFQDMYRRENRTCPVSSWLLHDTKTMFRTLTGSLYGTYDLDSGLPKGFVAHDALHDACLEVLKVQELNRKFFS